MTPNGIDFFFPFFMFFLLSVRQDVHFRPKKAVEGLLRHLLKKWERAVSQLGQAYELHLVGLVVGQPDICLSWKSQGISTTLTV